MRAQKGQWPRRRSAAALAEGRRCQIKRVQRSNKGGFSGGGAANFSMRIAAIAGSITTGAAAGINAICTGATICAEDSPMAGVGALRWQQGAIGAELWGAEA